MKMNTANLADISEIIGSMAVIITLIFLVLQMRENTRAIEASTRQAARDADVQSLISAMDHPDAILAWSKPEITDEEAIRYTLWLVITCRNRENDWLQYQRGVMDEDSWKRYKSAITTTFRTERSRNWWVNYGTSAFNPGFVEEVNGILEETPVSNVQKQIWYKTLFESPDVYQKVLNS